MRFEVKSYGGVYCCGEEIRGDKILMPVDYLRKAESVPGRIYEVVVKGKVSEPERVIGQLPSELYRRFRAKTRYIEAGKDFVRMQIEGSPFAWAEFMALLPEILSVLGVVVAFISVLMIIHKAPWEVFGLVLGIVLALKGRDIVEMFTRKRERRYYIEVE